MKRLAALLFVLATACEAAPIVEPSPSPGRLAAPPAEVWAYSGTLLRPGDPSLYENVLDAAVPLRDGGWLVLRQVSPRRSVPPPPGVGGQLFRPSIAMLMRLDAQGREVAREHGSEPFALRELRVFEDLGLVIGYGAQVLGGSIHAFDLKTLDGLWTLHDRDPLPCVQVADRCWTYRRSALSTDTTALTERDPRTYRALRTFHHLGMDRLDSAPGIYPAANAVVWNEPGAPIQRGLARVERLELDRPPAAWAARIDTACWALPAGPTHLYLGFGSCLGDFPTTAELFDVASGRTVREWPGKEAPLMDGSTGLLSWDEAFVDLRDGSRGARIPGRLLALDVDRGVAATRLSAGGAAVYRRVGATPAPIPVAFREVVRLTCAGFEFAQVATARDRDGRCPDAAAHAGGRSVLVTRGRTRGAEELTIIGVAADAATRELTVGIDVRGDQRVVPAAGVARIIELPGTLHGEWLVRLDRGTGRLDFVDTFVIDLPAPGALPTATHAAASPSPLPPRAVRASWGDSQTTAADIAGKLALAGYSPRYGGQAPGQLLFGADANDIYHVDEHRVSVLLFADTTTAEEVFQMLAAGRHTVTFAGSAQFVKIGKTVVIVLTRERSAGVPLVQALAN